MGAKDWKNLLPANKGESMNEDLRKEIIRYGEFAQACYDGFNWDESSPSCGDSKYTKEELLKSAGLPSTGYEVTKFIYATAQLWLPAFFKRPEDNSGEDTWSRDSNWMGFIAVATSPEEIRRLGRRDIVIAWRGTVTKLEWIENVKDVLRPSGLDPRDNFTNGIEVESGFLSIYTSRIPKSRYNDESARYQVLYEINRLLNLYKGERLSITTTGHSLGGALALLSAYDIAELGANTSEFSPRSMLVQSASFKESTVVSDTLTSPKPKILKVDVVESTGIATKYNTSMVRVGDSSPHGVNLKAAGVTAVPVTVISFSAPRVGDADFRDRCSALGLKVLRVLNRRDMVPKVPGVFINEKWLSFLLQCLDLIPWTYSHVGKEFALDSVMSPYLRRNAGIVEQHSLQALLHLVDGYQGPGKPFKLSGTRDLALVNKGSDFLKPELGIKPHWGGIDA